MKNERFKIDNTDGHLKDYPQQILFVYIAECTLDCLIETFNRYPAELTEREILEYAEEIY